MSVPGRTWPKQYVVTNFSYHLSSKQRILLFSLQKKYCFPSLRHLLRQWLVRPSCQAQSFFQAYYSAVCLGVLPHYWVVLCCLVALLQTISEIVGTQTRCNWRNSSSFLRTISQLVRLLCYFFSQQKCAPCIYSYLKGLINPSCSLVAITAIYANNFPATSIRLYKFFHRDSCTTCNCGWCV